MRLSTILTLLSVLPASASAAFMHASGGRSCATFPRRNAICSWKMQADHSSEARQVLKAPEDRRLFLARAACAVGAMAGTASASQAAAPFSPASQTSVKQINASSATAGSGDSLNPPPPRCTARRKAAVRPCRKLKSVPNPREFTRAGRTIAIKQSFDKNGSRSTGSAVWEGDVVLTKYMQVRCPQRLDYHSGGRRKCSQRADAHAAPRRSVDVCSESAALTLSRTARGIG